MAKVRKRVIDRGKWHLPVRVLLADAVAVAVAWVATISVPGIGRGGSRPLDVQITLGIAVVAAVLAILARKGSRNRSGRLDRTDDTAAIALASLTGLAALFAAALVSDVHIAIGELAFLPFAFLALVASHGVRRARATGDAVGEPREHRERVVIIGAGAEACELAELVDHHPEGGLDVVGVVGERWVATLHGLGERWLGPTDAVVDVLRQVDADSVIVTSTGFRGPQFKAVTNAVLRHGYLVRLTTGVSRWNTTRLQIDSIVHEPLLAVRARHTSAVELRLKRLTDVVGAAGLLLCTAPLMAAAAVAIKLEDGGPILFRQRRVGLDGAEFSMRKFRSMVPDAESRRSELDVHNERKGPLFKLERDPRVTRVGAVLRQSSIDELPQLLDVLRGDMSLVGPRPPLPDERNTFDLELEDRFNVRPGITGLWQVEARDNPNFAAYRRLDLHYVENWSLWLDLCIMLATVDQLISRIVAAPFRRRLREPAGAMAGAEGGAPPGAAARSPEAASPQLPERVS